MKKRIWLVLGALVFAAVPRDVHAVAAGDLVIREFRLRGPASPADEYIVVHNRTASDITVAASDASAGFAVASSDGNLVFTIPNGTVIKAMGHFLGVNTGGFSLGAQYNAAWTTDIGDGLGLALFDTADPAAFGTTATTLDAVGIGGSTSPYLEGTALTAITTPGEYAWIRKAAINLAVDTNNNASDFLLVATDAGIYDAVQSVLGPPSPANSAEQDLSSGLPVTLVEPAAGANSVPNLRRITTPVHRYEFRRRITNNTGGPLTAIRLHIRSVTTLNSPGYSPGTTQADLRPMDSATTVLNTPTSIGITTVTGLTLHTPPTQPLGGGWNSLLTIPGGPLAHGASVDVNIALQIVRLGTFSFVAGIETSGAIPVSAPTMNPPGGSYNASQSVSLATPTVGATIYYTTDGSPPSSSSTLYAGTPVLIDQTKTLQAISTHPGWLDSAVSSATYTLTAATPQIFPNGGTFQGTQLITLSTTTETPLEIWYTVDGSTPTSGAPSLLYSGPFSIATPLAVKAAAFKAGWTASTPAGAAFVPTVATPVFTPAPGSYTTSQAVTITTATGGASIHYTTDGNPPTILSPVYSGPVNLTQTTTLKAAAFLAGWADSLTATGGYTIKVADPVLSPASGKWYTQRNVQVTTATPGAALYYTTDGTEPTTSSAVVTGGQVLVDRPTSLKVKAFKAGAASSSTIRGSYLVTGQIAGADSHSTALKADGTVWTVGRDDFGQIGDGTPTTLRLNFVQVMTDVVAIASGVRSSYALKSDGTVWAWGYNADGRLGNGNTTNQFAPVQVTALTGVTAIASGGNHALALLADGTVRSWGQGSAGQLGRNSTASSSIPVTVTGLSNVKALAAGLSHSMALKNDGRVVAWGAGWAGQVGDGAGVARLLPVTLSGLVATDIAARGDASHAILAVGRALVSWGFNFHGQVGDGTSTNRLSPVTVKTGVRELGAGNLHLAFSSFDGRLWGVGNNGNRALGDGSASTRLLPVRSLMSKSVATIGGGLSYAFTAVATGEVWAAGANSYGNLGLGNTVSPTLPTIVPSFTLFSGAGLDADLDGDGLDLYEEILLGTDPLLVDTNGNGLSDLDEFTIGTEGGGIDSDKDGLSNEAEALAGTDPLVADSDGDGTPDGADAFPLDPTKSQLNAQPGDITAPTITLTRPTAATPIP